MRRTLLGTTAAVAMFGAAIAAAPAPKFLDGYTITMKLMNGTRPEPSTATFKVAADKMRIEMDMAAMGGRGGQATAGAYMIFQPNGKIAAYVPAMNMAISMDASAISGGGGRGRGMAPPADATDISVTVDDLGAGESIAGHPTHKYRAHHKYTQNGTVHEGTTDMWMSTDFPGADGAFAKFGSFASASGGSQLGSEISAKMPKGMPMKLVNTSDGATNSMEVTDIKKSAFGDGDFDLPAGVQVIDMNAMMGGRRGGGN